MLNKLLNTAIAIGMLIACDPLAASSQLTVTKINNDRQMLKPTAADFGRPLKARSPITGAEQGILICEGGRLNAQGFYPNCVVSNMPTLNQTEPSIDADVQDMGLFGCYDTSIVTVILTALADRKNQSQLSGRVKEFANVPATEWQPKVYRQLSWQYRVAKMGQKGEKDQTGKTIQPLYFPEVLADFGKISEKCDPFTYGSCATATNGFGSAFRQFITTQNWTNEMVIQKMREGHILLIAFARYDSRLELQPDGTSKIKFIKKSLHKVVFSGFQTGKYPLLINDVGTGKQYRVRLTTDLSQRKFGVRNSSPKMFSPSSFDYPTDTHIFLEYEGDGTGVNDQVFFIEHIDGFKLN